jgi:hypothetical protein
MQKKIISVHEAHAPHMVGDGLPVRNVFSYNDLGNRELSPFLMLDYGSPVEFPPTEEALGVGMHPHRGFETVTLAYQGGLEHRDTAGNYGVIGPGDVQWMTAGSGVLHEELHSKEFRKTGGTLQMAQLWVNLPAQLKMTAPRYQTLQKTDIPTIEVQDGKGKIRVVAGSYKNTKGPAHTFTPINLLDVRLSAGADLTLDVPAGYTTAIVILDGELTLNDERPLKAFQLAVLERAGDQFKIGTASSAHVLVLNGEPINEPVVGYGPFVMNTSDQIHQAIEDFRQGRFAANAPSPRG